MDREQLTNRRFKSVLGESQDFLFSSIKHFKPMLLFENKCDVMMSESLVTAL